MLNIFVPLFSVDLFPWLGLVFNSCDVLRPYVTHIDDIFKDFTSYKCRVPVTGAIILDETYERVRQTPWGYLRFFCWHLSLLVDIMLTLFCFFVIFSACWWRDGKDRAGAFPAERRARMKKTMLVPYVRLVSILLYSCLLCGSFILHFCSKIDSSNDRNSLIISAY